MVRRLLRVSETRYSVGKGLQQDVLQAQVELSGLLEEGISLKQNRRALENEMNDLLSRKVFAPIPIPEDIPLPDISLSMEHLKRSGLSSNPGLAFRKLEIEEARADVELARKNYYPDFDVTLAYGQREEDRMGNDLTDFASASVMMTIPLWKHQKQDNKLTAAEKRLAAKEAAYRDFATGISFKIETLVDEINTTRENYRLYQEGVLTQAEQWARSSQNAYQVNSIEFNTMINARIRVLRFRLVQKKYLYQLYKQRAQLTALIGESPEDQNTQKENSK